MDACVWFDAELGSFFISLAFFLTVKFQLCRKFSSLKAAGVAVAGARENKGFAVLAWTRCLKRVELHMDSKVVNNSNSKTSGSVSGGRLIQHIVRMLGMGWEMQKVGTRAEEKCNRKMKIRATEVAIQLLGSIGYDPDYGARPVMRAIQQNAENELS
ncbi:unnamed protein product [Trifolium pratense]|uniref:Uncharacterized protein n=1 Tax=Trifolium pratense TaxID=57577 RepID=A0ACB0L8J7_TRIPR|nr:unnamed protein product [Trifolium pratense]